MFWVGSAWMAELVCTAVAESSPDFFDSIVGRFRDEVVGLLYLAEKEAALVTVNARDLYLDSLEPNSGTISSPAAAVRAMF